MIKRSWDKEIWVAHRINVENDELPEYEKPVKYYLNIQKVKGYLSILQYGEKVEKTYKAVFPINLIPNYRFKAGDKAYVDNCIPNMEYEEEYGYGSSANAEIIDVDRPNISVNMTLQKLI